MRVAPRSVLGPLAALVLMLAESQVGAQQPVGPGFTYQGLLKQAGVPYSGDVDLVFELYDDPNGGAAIGLPDVLNSWPVADGLFNAEVNIGSTFGPQAFNGQARWLRISANGQPLTPRQPILAAPYALCAMRLPHGTMPLVNVQDYGASGACDCTGVCDDTAAVQAALAALPAGGGVLYFPEGVYCLRAGVVQLQSNMLVLGAGRASRLVEQPDSGNGGIFRAVGQHSIRITSLAFEQNLEYSTEVGLKFDDSATTPCSDIVVDHCYFYTCATPGLDWTPMAILGRGVAGFWVLNNRFERLQVRASGDLESAPYQSGGTFVVGNQFIDPHNYAVSCTALASHQRIEDVVIADNVIINQPGAGGIYVGTDGDMRRIDTCKRIVVRHNTISGDWGTGGDGIVLRMARDSRDWIVEGNVLDMDPAADGTMGIRIQCPDQQPGAVALASLLVANNAVRRTRGPGIVVLGPVSGFVISGNRLEGTEGIQVLSNYLGGPVDGIVTSNVANGVRGSGESSTGHGVRVAAEGADVGPVLVRDNVFKNHWPAGHWSCSEYGSYAAGIVLVACTGQRIVADVVGNRCYDDQAVKTQRYGVEERGGGTFETRYVNNVFTGNGIAGARLLGSGVQVLGNQFKDNLTGIQILGSQVMVMGNDVRGNSMRGMDISGGEAVVRNNLGWVTENRNQDAIAEHQTSKVVSHGLSVTPLPGSIGITLLNDPGVDPGQIWVSDIGDASFTVHCANAPPADQQLQFGWRVVLAQN